VYTYTRFEILTAVTINTGHTQKIGAVSKLNSFETVTFFCVCPVLVTSAT
jgi:hypothetical protein